MLMPHLAAWIGRLGSAQIVDAAFLFNPYSLASHLAACGMDPNPLMQQVKVARAFTCYQVDTLLRQLPNSEQPLAVLGLLMTFQDEAVRLAERRRLLTGCLHCLQSYPGQVLVAECTLDACPDLLEMVRHTAREVIESAPSPTVQALTLF
jgi:hypothetical protein